MKYSVKKMKSVAKQLNDLTYTDYYFRLSQIATSIFKWNNLPNLINEAWIEDFLFNEGKCMFFEDDTLGLMVAKCAPYTSLNPYEEPTHIVPYAVNYFGEPKELWKECVLIRNTDLEIPTRPTLQLFAYRLATIERAIDVNINAQKTPVAILCSEKQKVSFKHLYNQYEGNEPVIFGARNTDTSAITTIDTTAPCVFDKLQLQKNNVWNEAMRFLGINNANMDKRERLVAGEVDANNDQIEISAEVMLKNRQLACERINEMFGTNISVELRVQPTQIKEEQEIKE